MKEYKGQNNHGRPMLDGLKIVSRCPVCSTEHDPIETTLVDEANGSHLIYIQCRRCGSGVVATVTPTNFGLSSVGLLTDLNGREIVCFKDGDRVSADDLLELVRHFKSNYSLPL